MSEQPQGPGWWQASDLRWYPPHLKPGAAPGAAPPGGPAPAPYPAPGAAQPWSGGPPIPPRRRRGGGCLVSLLIVVALVGGLVIAGGALWQAAKDKLEEQTRKLSGTGTCTFVDDGAATKVLGGTVQFHEVSGVGKIVQAGLDTRLLPDAEACWSTLGSSGLVRVARDDGGSAVFAAERARARTGQQANGATPATTASPYYWQAVKGLGDEAFCTAPSMQSFGGSGLLVRRGRTVLAVTLTAQVPDSTPSQEIDSDVLARQNCRRAVKLAKISLPTG